MQTISSFFKNIKLFLFLKIFKTFYYLTHIKNYFFIKQLTKEDIKKLNSLYKTDRYIKKRVDYYNKISKKIFDLGQNTNTIKSFVNIKTLIKKKKSGYFLDFRAYLISFSKNLKISYIFGDIREVAKKPTFVKSRPISRNNKNSILFKLNTARHFIFLKDPYSFEQKKNILVWRGNCFQRHREEFLKKCYGKKNTDFGQTTCKKKLNHQNWQQKKLSINEQLKYKFILSIEGADVATNLKWIMSSNSLVFMPKPKFETWFMEGVLKPNFHYVCLRDDFKDLDEKIDFYTKNPDDAKKIINNSNAYIRQFQDKKQEDTILKIVLLKYFEQTRQINNS